MPVKVGGCAKQNSSLKQGAQVSNFATHRAATTTRHCDTEKLRVDACQPLYSPRITKRGEGKVGSDKLQHKSKIWHSKVLHNLPERVCII